MSNIPWSNEDWNYLFFFEARCKRTG
jgi:hypothetical protein